MILMLLKKLLKKKGEVKKESSFFKIIDWISTGYCLMNCFFYMILILGILTVIISLSQQLGSVLKFFGIS